MNLTEKVMEIIHGVIECDEITPESRLQEDIGLDSFGLVTLLIELEDALMIELDESDMDPFELETVSDVTEMVSAYCESGSECGEKAGGKADGKSTGEADNKADKKSEDEAGDKAAGGIGSEAGNESTDDIGDKADE